ncbi:MAG: hypothetical protein KIT62_10070 [Cyclobacteriaceae bacterium]|nr:hypothetical protein [Cyclobacteriaceae bacterium]
MKKISLLLVIPVLSGIFGCQEDNFSLDEINIEVLTMDNEIVKNTFEEGTDVVLALKIKNQSSKTFEWSYDYECELSRQQDFMLVKKEVQTEDPNITSVSVGIPYQFPLNCPTVGLPPRITISPGEETIVMAYAWSSNPDNTVLQTGQYFSEFTITIEVESHQKSWNLKTDFIIE